MAEKSPGNEVARITANVSTKINKFKIYERFAVTAYFFSEKNPSSREFQAYKIWINFHDFP